MTYKSLSLLAALATLTFAAPSAFAGAQDDVQRCRVAMTSQSNIDMSEYRLRFERSKGHRVRTVYLKAIPKKGGKAFRFECYLNRSTVTALKTDTDVLYAAN